MADYPAATATQQADNERVCVTEWRFPPGHATGWHRHGYDYVVVPMTNGVLTLQHPDGTTTEGPITMGQSYYRKSGVEHDVINLTDREIVFVEIEFKTPG